MWKINTITSISIRSWVLYNIVIVFYIVVIKYVVLNHVEYPVSPYVEEYHKKH